MRETQEHCVVLDDVDADVFAAFAQFTHSDKYTIKKETPSTQISDDAAIPGMDWETVRDTMKKRSDNNRKSHQPSTQRYPGFHHASKRLRDLIPGSILGFPLGNTLGHEPPVSIELIESFAEVLLHHARIAVFGQRFRIERLLCEAQNSLRGVLFNTDRKYLWFVDVMSLIWFCYSQEVPEAMRHMVVTYAADRFEYYWPVRRFRLLVCLIDELEESLHTAVQDRMDRIDGKNVPTTLC